MFLGVESNYIFLSNWSINFIWVIFSRGCYLNQFN